MAKRLVKVAKELNVGTSTIVEHLNSKGFDIDNKPTAKVTDEMYSELLNEFQRSIAIKEKADQLIIGTRPAPPKKESVKEEITNPIPTPPKVVKEEDTPPPIIEEPTPTPVVEVVETIEEPIKPKVGLKVLGKINLDQPKKKTPAPEPEPEPDLKEDVKEKVEEVLDKDIVSDEVNSIKNETPSSVEENIPVESKPIEINSTEKEIAEESSDKSQTIPSPSTEKEQLPKTKSEEEGEAVKDKPQEKEMIRAATPELRGLKILGKIEIKDKPKKGAKSDKDKKSNKEGNKPSDNKDQPKKRRRKRKKVVQSSGDNNSNQGRGNRGGNNRGGGNRGGNNRGGNRRGGPKRDEVKEVSAKEIEEKIKATMARLQGGNKKKRQRLRREHRENIREKQELRELENEPTGLQLTEFVSVSELASLMNVPVTEVITTCMNLGVIVSINQRLDAEIIELVADEFGHTVEFISAEEEVEEEEEIIDDPADLVPRSPIVTVMGHVDHGKTSLLDYIRNANVADGEAGGITQHIGAYEVEVGEEKKRITFLDTPGHEAFTAMRARGAKVTDIAIIIISADDKIMPQTKEAISHAQAAGVPMVFAINKIDKDGAQPDRIKQELAGMNLLIEEWGGDYQSQDISAKMGTNIDELLEKVLLQAELLELQANPSREALGTVIEASLDKGRGYVTKILVQNGSLQIGDPIVAGEHSGKIKAMFNERGKKVKSAGPSTPVLVLGLSGAPQAGEKFKEMASEPEARQIASRRAQITREQSNRANKRISLDEIGRRLALGNFKELNLIVKGDVDGSIEALSDSLIKQSIETVQVNVIHKAVGQIIESDVLLASASDAIIIGFQVRPSLGARKLAEREGVQIKMYSIIYEAIEEVRAAIEGMLEPTQEEKIMGQVQVREVYKISRVGTVAGCYVQEGRIARNSNVRIIRNGIVIYPTKEGVVGELASLKRFKDDVKDVKNGMECGVSIKNYNDIKVDDIIEAYEIVEIKQKLG